MNSKNKMVDAVSGVVVEGRWTDGVFQEALEGLGVVDVCWDGEEEVWCPLSEMTTPAHVRQVRFVAKSRKKITAVVG